MLESIQVISMNRIARFEKVTREQFIKDSNIEDVSIYDEIELPARATRGSAGYDFHKTVHAPRKQLLDIQFAWYLRSSHLQIQLTC